MHATGVGQTREMLKHIQSYRETGKRVLKAVTVMCTPFVAHITINRASNVFDRFANTLAKNPFTDTLNTADERQPTEELRKLTQLYVKGGCHVGKQRLNRNEV